MVKKRSRFAAPDPYTLSPLFALLPEHGQLIDLEGLSSSLFARLDGLLSIKESLDRDQQREEVKKLVAEEAMLRVALEWLSVKVDSPGR